MYFKKMLPTSKEMAWLLFCCCIGFVKGSNLCSPKHQVQYCLQGLRLIKKIPAATAAATLKQLIPHHMISLGSCNSNLFLYQCSFILGQGNAF